MLDVCPFLDLSDIYGDASKRAMGHRRFFTLERIGLDIQNRNYVKQAQLFAMAMHDPEQLSGMARDLFSG